MQHFLQQLESIPFDLPRFDVSGMHDVRFDISDWPRLFSPMDSDSLMQRQVGHQPICKEIIHTANPATEYSLINIVLPICILIISQKNARCLMKPATPLLTFGFRDG